MEFHVHFFLILCYNITIAKVARKRFYSKSKSLKNYENVKLFYKEDFMRKIQQLGRALMVPVAILPAAAILMGIGYYIDPDGWGGGSAMAAFFIKSGAAILDNLGILFACGVAYGLSKDKDGASAFSGMVAFLVITTLLSPGAVSQLRGGLEVLPTEGFAKINNPFIGILSGLVGAWCYNKFGNVKLPDYLAFFSGRRFAPIMTSFIMLAVSGVMFFVWPVIFGALVAFGTSIVSLGSVGAGIYAFFNRLLIPAGLHHALNSVFWFDIVGLKDIPLFLGGQGTIDLFAQGEEAIKAAGLAVRDVSTIGMYQAGFFPIMMFGLPGAALAMIHTAKPEKKTMVKSLMMAGAFASFLTGVTEPIEFAFMFLAPALYLVHALLTGVAVFLASTFGWMAGFGFSAGLIDMFLSAKNPLATNWFMLVPMGLVFFAIYYFVFKFAITTFNLKTPGREEEDANEGVVLSKDTNFTHMAAVILEGLGGKDNVDTLDHCITRLRVEVKDPLLVNEKKIKEVPVAGVLRPSKNGVQVIVGPQVQFVYDEVRKLAH